MLQAGYPQERAGHTWDKGPGPAQSPSRPAPGLGGLRPDGAGPSRMWGRGGVVKDPVKRDGRAWWCLPTPSAQPLLNAQPPSDLL